MEFKLLHIILALVSLAFVVSHAAAPSEVYWNAKLPNTPMPKAVESLLHPTEWMEEKSTSVAVGKGGVNVDAGKGKPRGGTNVNVGHGGVSVNTGKSGKGTRVGVGGKGVNVRTGPKGKPVYVNVSPFIYRYAATENQLHDNPDVALFFLEKDLHQGKNFNLHFVESTKEAPLLPRLVANKIPFKTSNLPEILNQFSVNPNSMEAEVMKKTITECEETSIQGEEKHCATSLESMVDFSISKLGKDIKAMSTESEGKSKLQKYSISGVQKVESGKAVVCHKLDYAYAVFYCHKTQTTIAYTVSMVGTNGSKANAVAVCHKDTSAWNPKHLAFQVLKVKPGTLPICHFLPEDHIVWVPKN